MKKRASYFIIGILFISLTAFGQNQEKNISTPEKIETKVDLVRTIRLEKDSKTEEVFIEIKEKTKGFQLMINSSVSNGQLTIELYDPNEIKQGNFTIGTQLESEKKEQVNGNIRKSIIEPQFGKWKVKIIPKDVTGNVKINTAIVE
ncbi:MAG: hypothetical protein GY870_06960 [archaeon]|nr:hypothetical protein [archaeon]